jgi:hypothetical protein
MFPGHVVSLRGDMGGCRIRQIWPRVIFFCGATSKPRYTNTVPKLWKILRRQWPRKLLPFRPK